MISSSTASQPGTTTAAAAAAASVAQASTKCSSQSHAQHAQIRVCDVNCQRCFSTPKQEVQFEDSGILAVNVTKSSS
jgi:hypothetical protein